MKCILFQPLALLKSSYPNISNCSASAILQPSGAWLNLIQDIWLFPESIMTAFITTCQLNIEALNPFAPAAETSLFSSLTTYSFHRLTKRFRKWYHNRGLFIYFLGWGQERPSTKECWIVLCLRPPVHQTDPRRFGWSDGAGYFFLPPSHILNCIKRLLQID